MACWKTRVFIDDFLIETSIHVAFPSYVWLPNSRGPWFCSSTFSPCCRHAIASTVANSSATAWIRGRQGTTASLKMVKMQKPMWETTISKLPSHDHKWQQYMACLKHQSWWVYWVYHIEVWKQPWSPNFRDTALNSMSINAKEPDASNKICQITCHQWPMDPLSLGCASLDDKGQVDSSGLRKE